MRPMEWTKKSFSQSSYILAKASAALLVSQFRMSFFEGTKLDHEVPANSKPCS